MKAFQRLYTAGGSFKEEPSSAELIYVTADGHEHWHLQRAAKYSLWNAEKTAEVTPAMKVGFCLDDSEHVETGIGPKEAVYSDSTGREFCRQHQPEATSLFEGVWPGGVTCTALNLAFQWVEALNVLPGEYWLREDVNPTGVIKEAGGANAPAYASKATIIPGFNALAEATGTRTGEAKALALTSRAWNDSATPKYTIASQPSHGTLSAVSKNQVTYTPAPGYVGPDSFTYSAADPNSPFPTHPAFGDSLDRSQRSVDRADARTARRRRDEHLHRRRPDCLSGARKRSSSPPNRAAPSKNCSSARTRARTPA